MADERTTQLRIVAESDRKAEGWLARRDAAIVQAHRAGASYREIAAICTLSHMSIKRIIEKGTTK